MKKVRVYFFSAILSWEFLLLSIAIVAFFFAPNQVQLISSRLKDSDEILKYLVLLPVGMALWVSRKNPDILFPEDDNSAFA